MHFSLVMHNHSDFGKHADVGKHHSICIILYKLKRVCLHQLGCLFCLRRFISYLNVVMVIDGIHMD